MVMPFCSTIEPPCDVSKSIETILHFHGWQRQLARIMYAQLSGYHAGRIGINTVHVLSFIILLIFLDRYFAEPLVKRRLIPKGISFILTLFTAPFLVGNIIANNDWFCEMKKMKE